MTEPNEVRTFYRQPSLAKQLENLAAEVRAGIAFPEPSMVQALRAITGAIAKQARSQNLTFDDSGKPRV